MVFEYILGTLAILIDIVYNFAIEISIAIFTIVFALICSIRFRRRTKQRQEEIKLQKDNEIIRQGLQASFKQAKRNLIEKKMISPEDRDKEKERESHTLMQVMKLIEDRKDLFPESSLDDIKQQLNLYRNE